MNIAAYEWHRLPTKNAMIDVRGSRRALRAALLSCTLSLPGVVFAHSGEIHEDPGVSVDADDSVTVTVPVEPDVLPERIAKLGGAFSLIDQSGKAVTEQTYAGKHMLVFFGYSNCQIMCSISLTRIAEALNILQADPDAPLTKLRPLVITVDPANDTPERLRESLGSYHPALTGLTGTLEQLRPVYEAYGQKPSVLDMELNENSVISHSSYFFLMNEQGELQTLFPPILDAQRMASIIKKYLPM